MALADIMLKIGKKILESPNFGDTVKTIANKCSDSIKAKKAEKAAKDKAFFEECERKEQMHKKKYDNMRKMVLDFIKQNIRENKYKISPETKKPIYDIWVEAGKCITNYEDWRFFTIRYPSLNDEPEDVQEMNRWYKEYKQKQKEKKLNAKKRIQTKTH